MTFPCLGGLRLTGATWLSPSTLRVRFTSTHGDAACYQLYAGRTRIGDCAAAGRAITASLAPSDWPEHLTLLAVDPAQRQTDYGSLLPLRPYNRARLAVTTVGWTDAEFVDVLSGDAPGEAVNNANRIERILFDENRTYRILTPPLPGTGTWNLAAVGRDTRPNGGNLGTPIALAVDVLAHPPDLIPDSAGRRFALAIDEGVATIEGVYP